MAAVDVNRPEGVRGTYQVCEYPEVPKTQNANRLEDLEVFRMNPLTVARIKATYNPSSTEESVPQLCSINEN
jgi:hypothetical protein